MDHLDAISNSSNILKLSTSVLARDSNISISDEDLSWILRMMNGSYDPEDLSDEREYIFDRLYVRVIFIVLYSIVFCFCFFEFYIPLVVAIVELMVQNIYPVEPPPVRNLMVILVVTLHWRMRNITKFCLANLAFADLCVGVFCVYQNLSTYLINSWVLGEFLCKMYQFINALSHTASVLILVVICVERYLAILHPFRCKQLLTINRLRILIVAVWLASAIYCSPRLYYIVTLKVFGMDGRTEIICTAKRTLYDSKTFDMVHFFLLFLLPLLVISVLYTRMGITLWRTSKNEFPWTPASASTATNLSHSSSETINEESPVSNRVQSVRLTKLTKRDQCISKKEKRGQREKNGISNANPSSSSNGLSNRRLKETPQHSFNATKSSSYTVTVENKCYVVGLDPNEMKIADIPKSKQTLSLHSSLTLAESSSSQSVGQDSTFTGLPASEVCTNTSIHLRSQEQITPELETTTNQHCFPAPDSPRKGIKGYVRKSLRFHGESYVSNNQKRRCKKSQTTNLRGGKDALKSRQTVVRMLIVVVVTFALCNFPFHLRKIFQYWWPNYDYVSIFSTLATPLTHLIMYANCAINPMIYAFMSKAFRSSFQDLLCCRWKKSFYPVTQPLPRGM